MHTATETRNSQHAPLDLAREALAKGREAAHEAVALGYETAQDYGARSREAVEQRLSAAGRWASAQTKDRPLRALGIAAAVGAVLAVLFTRR